MKRICLVIFLFLFVSYAKSQQPARTVNFSTSIEGAGNFNSITDAISGLATPNTIWVSTGTFTEDELIIPSGITLIGGFPADATSLSDRIFPGHAATHQQSILDGQYSHRVATVYGELDGFVITKGYTFDTIPNSITGAGGGLLIDGGTVTNCIIHNNVASELRPSPGTIPGTFVASIGDIYCTDGTVLRPVYTLNQQGTVVADLEGGIPEGKTPQGIVFFVDPSPTSGRFFVMGKITTSKIWFNPPFDVPNLPNIATEEDAMKDFEGRSNTDSLSIYLQDWFINNPWWHDPNYALKHIEEYNTPVGTLGEWHLPAGGELYKMWEVFPQMDACARDVLGWISGSSTMFSKGLYISSTEYDSSQMWGLQTYSYPWGGWGLKASNKTTPGFVVPVAVKYQSHQ